MRLLRRALGLCAAERLRSIRAGRWCSTATNAPPNQPSVRLEPAYLDMEQLVKEYPTLQIKLTGHDFSVLEAYTKHVHRLVEKFFKFENSCYAVPACTWRVSTFNERSTVVKHTYELVRFERKVQIESLPATAVALLVDALRTSLPEGVELRLQRFDDAEEQFRWVPDVEVRGLETELDELGGPTTRPF